jgi:hypothetical protein
LTIIRVAPNTQGSSLPLGGSLPSTTIEEAIDLAAMRDQQLSEKIGRSLLLPVSSSTSGLALPEPSTDKVLGWNAAATALENKTPNTGAYLATPVAVSEGGTGAVTASAARTALDVSQAINSLTAETAPALADSVAIYDASAAADRKMTLENALKVLDALTEDTAPDAGADFLLAYDTSAAGAKKAKSHSFGIPQNSQSAAYTLVLADAGKHILHPSADTTARVFTIPANASVAFVVGTAITFVNQNAAGVITISITSDTMRLSPSGATGSRTLAANGMATALKITATEWIISGTGLT